jgi:hypothetical protein
MPLLRKIQPDLGAAQSNAETKVIKVRAPATLYSFPTKKKEVQILHSPVITVQLENNALRATELLLALRIQLSQNRIKGN